MERRKCTTAGAAVIGALLLLGTGVWWLSALERDRRDLWVQDDPAEPEDLAEPADLAGPALVADQDREAILGRLSAELGSQPTVLSWRPEPLCHLARQGVQVVRVTYQCCPKQQPGEGYFLVAKGRVLRLPGRPTATADGRPVCGGLKWQEELKELDRALGFFKATKARE